jgi:hypothetical protein
MEHEVHTKAYKVHKDLFVMLCPLCAFVFSFRHAGARGVSPILIPGGSPWVSGKMYFYPGEPY